MVPSPVTGNDGIKHWAQHQVIELHRVSSWHWEGGLALADTGCWLAQSLLAMHWQQALGCLLYTSPSPRD